MQFFAKGVLHGTGEGLLSNVSAICLVKLRSESAPRLALSCNLLNLAWRFHCCRYQIVNVATGYCLNATAELTTSMSNQSSRLICGGTPPVHVNMSRCCLGMD